MMDLKPPLPLQITQNLSDGWMGYLINRLTILALNINDAELVSEKRRIVPAREITVLVDGCDKDAPTVLAIPCRIVCATPEKRNPKRCSADDHSSLSFRLPS
jgi:hypothetical protein